LNVALLTSLSRVTNLAELTIETQFDHISPFRLTFPVLEVLRVATLAARAIPRLLLSISAPCLRVLDLQESPCMGETEAKEIMRAICSLCGRQLRVLNILLTLRIRTETQLPLLDMIGLLFSFRDLQEVRLNMDHWDLSLSDEDIRAVAEAWPKLNVLHFPGIPCVGWRNKAQLSADSLIYVALSYPKLISLQLPLFNLVHTSDIVPAKMLRHNLQEFHIVGVGWRSWDSGRVDALAQLLHDIFPQLCLDLYNRNPNWTRVLERYSDLRTKRS